MSGSIPTACVGEDIDLSNVVLNGSVLEPGDSTFFIVHDGTPGMIGNVVDTPQLGIIEYKPEFIPGITYYLTAIAGNTVEWRNRSG